MMITRTLQFSILISALAVGAAGPAMAQSCTRQGVDVTCDDGRRGIFAGESPSSGPTARDRTWPRRIRASSSATNRPSSIGQGVFAGQGKGDGADGKSERAEQGALPGAGRRVVLLLSWIRTSITDRRPQTRNNENNPMQSRMGPACRGAGTPENGLSRPDLSDTARRSGPSGAATAPADQP